MERSGMRGGCPPKRETPNNHQPKSQTTHSTKETRQTRIYQQHVLIIGSRRRIIRG